MLTRMKPRTKRILLTVLYSAGAVGYLLLMWQGPWWIDGAHLRKKDLQPADGVVITGFRTMLVALGGGAVAALGLMYTHRKLKHDEKLFQHAQEQFELAQLQFNHAQEKDREQAEISRESQVNDRYVDAVKLLGSENITECLGGIYALERIMHDSEKDHRTVVEVLAAFIRQQAPASDLDKGSTQSADTEHKPEEHVRAALAVLGRRPDREEIFRIDLSRTDLRGAELGGLNLQRATFYGADLTLAHLSESNLQGAVFSRATLSGSILIGANLEKALLIDSDLEGALLRGANLQGASMAKAHLAGADLENVDLDRVNLYGVDLTEVEGVTVDRLLQASVYSSTKLPLNVLEDSRFEQITIRNSSYAGSAVDWMRRNSIYRLPE
ncbi:pentapeptide repeat-containing protein [Streptomyces viridosporus]|uniref:pentapeptide repeat-containing protein n=1 Tax=Streptomyces viridosporus TaxID=67581 RepID=UPI0033208ABC